MIENNVIKDCSSIGLTIDSCRKNEIWKNIISSNGQGLLLSYSKHNKIWENTISSNEKYGIYLNSKSDDN